MKKTAIAVLFAACVLGMIVACSGSKKDADAGPPRANARAERRLGSFERIEGTPHLIAPIESPREGEWLKSSGGQVTHNYVFFNTEDESTTLLLPTDDYAITSRLALPEKRTGSSPAAQWFLYSVIKADTDGDRELTSKDKRSLAVSDAGGRGYAELIENVEDVLGHASRDPNTLFVIYVSDGTRNVAKIDLANKRVISVKTLPELGSDVR